MAKKKQVYVCQNCGQEHSQWVGQCKSCKQWNTVVEEIVEKGKTPLSSNSTSPIASKLSEVEMGAERRLSSMNKELDRVLGGGIVPGAVILLGGEPGIGKSTLMLQLLLQLTYVRSLYISGEESSRQIRMRAERMKFPIHENCHLFTETDTAAIINQFKQLKPELVIVDSVQTLQSQWIESTPGSVSQIRQCTSELIHYAKQHHLPIFLIGHINKDGNIAGPKVLEHMVDVVLQFEGDRNHLYRLLRGQKNRFGPTSELGIYEMNANGLEEVANPSSIMLSGSQLDGLSGNAVGVTMEGVRPMMIEVQALVSSAVYGTPQRTANGFDGRRLNMLLAVLEKRAGFPLASKDVFLNITGGMRVEDPALDLAVVSAILSSAVDIAVSRELCFAAELGLSGELRPVSRLEQRIHEALKLGYKEIIVAAEEKYPQVKGIKVTGLQKIESLRDHLFA